MKIKVSKHKLNIHYRGSPWGSRTQQHAYCLRYAHSQHIESHLGKKQPQAKIPIAFLFSQLHFNVTSHALFYGGQLVMRSACKTRESPWWWPYEFIGSMKDRKFSFPNWLLINQLLGVDLGSSCAWRRCDSLCRKHLRTFLVPRRLSLDENVRAKEGREGDNGRPFLL